MDAAEARKLHDTLMADRPDGARHDSDICPFCVEQAQTTTFGTPPGTAGPDVSDANKNTEGGDNPTMTDISQETHTALLNQAVTDAVKTTETALAAKTEEAANATAAVTSLETEKATLTADVERLNKELDDVQVKLQAATDKVTELEKAAEEAADKAALTEVAGKRTEQVRNLKLFPDDYVAERAERWATLTDEAWAEQVDEWSKLKPAPTGDASSQDSASALTGTAGTGKEQQQQQDDAADGGAATPNARRSVLGLR